MIKEMKAGAIVQFKMHWESEPTPSNTAIVTRVAKDKSWADVETPYGSKRVPNPIANLKIVTKALVVHMS